MLLKRTSRIAVTSGVAGHLPDRVGSRSLHANPNDGNHSNQHSDSNIGLVIPTVAGGPGKTQGRNHSLPSGQMDNEFRDLIVFEAVSLTSCLKGASDSGKVLVNGLRLSAPQPRRICVLCRPACVPD